MQKGLQAWGEEIERLRIIKNIDNKIKRNGIGKKTERKEEKSERKGNSRLGKKRRNGRGREGKGRRG